MRLKAPQLSEPGLEVTQPDPGLALEASRQEPSPALIQSPPPQALQDQAQSQLAPRLQGHFSANDTALIANAAAQVAHQEAHKGRPEGFYVGKQIGNDEEARLAIKYPHHITELRIADLLQQPIAAQQHGVAKHHLPQNIGNKLVFGQALGRYGAEPGVQLAAGPGYTGGVPKVRLQQDGLVRLMNGSTISDAENLQRVQSAYSNGVLLADAGRSATHALQGPVMNPNVLSAVMLNRVPQGIMSQEGIDAANQNMQQLLERGDLDMVDLIAGAQTPGMMKRWVVENKQVFATRFSGALGIDELAYMGQKNFPVQNIVSPTSLTKDQAAEARNLYGDDANGAERYANYRNRAVVLNYMTSSVAMHALADTWDFVRDLNPVLFAYERAYRIKTGEDAWTGAPQNPLTAAAELAVGLFGAKAGRDMIRKSAQGMESVASSSGLMTSLNPYAKSEINAALKGSGLQRHHINESAVYGSVIEPSYGLTVPLAGWGKGTAHTKFHDAMNVFWKPYQKGGELFETFPTNAQVGQAQTGAFLNAGFTVGEAKYLSAAARAERYYHGLKDAAYVLRVPKT